MLENSLIHAFNTAFQTLYSKTADEKFVSFQKTRTEFEGDMTIVVFPFVKTIGKSPEAIANEIGTQLLKDSELVSGFNVVKGFLNLSISDEYWLKFFNDNFSNESFGKISQQDNKKIVIEYSSPNTNKPLHLGHVRNNLLGWSVAEILKANGHEVTKVNLVNDRGIHICKSMIAWKYWGGLTPEESNTKGDKLVGNMYVRFDKELKAQLAQLISEGQTAEMAAKNAPLMLEAQEMLRQWEAGDAETRKLWETMNNWVYEGFNQTYTNLGIDFDKTYYESQTYLSGKSIVLEGLDKQSFYRKDDNSIWCDLQQDGLDEKLLLRSDGTSVYITQDLGTAEERHDHYKADQMIYVVGNEQNYHFDVLKLILKKLGRQWADGIEHLSYGMVELPEGKMKSREGTVVDADDLVDEMVHTARQMTEELGKASNLSEIEADKLYKQIGLGALKYYILKVDPKKTMMFNPAESIDFNGNTGPFIQYTHARIRSVLQKAVDAGYLQGEIEVFANTGKEKHIVKILHQFPAVVSQAGEQRSPALIANYMYDLAKEYNQFYQACPIIREENESLKKFRIGLSLFVANVLKMSGRLLGMEMPDRM